MFSPFFRRLTSSITLLSILHQAVFSVFFIGQVDAATTSLRYAGTATEAGTASAWTNMSGALGDTTSTSALSQPNGKNKPTNQLILTNFNLATGGLSTGATISGITVEVEWNSPTMTDTQVQLTKNAGTTITGSNLASNTGQTVKAFKTYGGTSNLWGQTWTASELLSSNFGVVLTYTTNSAGGTHTINVYRVRVIVEYTSDTTPPVITINNNVASGPVTSDIINVSVADASPDTSTFLYSYSTDAVCNSSDFSSGGTLYTSGTNFTISTETNNGKYLCFKASDFAGNTTYQISANPLYVDTTKPVLTLSGTTPITVLLNASYTDAGASCTDNYAPLTQTITTTGSVNTTLTGTYTLHYYCQDTAGNTATGITRTVTVINSAPPIESGPTQGPGGGGGGAGAGVGSNSSSLGSQSNTISNFPLISPFVNQYHQPSTNIHILPTQSNLQFDTLTQDNQEVYTLENRITDFICPKIIKVFTIDQIRSQDIPEEQYRDDILSVVMFRGLEEDEIEHGETFIQEGKLGIAINDLKFEPTRNVTRAEFVKMIVRSLSCRYKNMGTDSGFSDVNPSMWYAPYITFATKNNWISGYSDGLFRPNAFITRAEAAKILARAIKLAYSDNATSSFIDVEDEDVFTPYIEALRESKIFQGTTRSTFDPDRFIPRTEVARIIYRTFLGGNPK